MRIYEFVYRLKSFYPVIGQSKFLCKENIACAVRYISRKDKSFASDAFLKIMDVLFQRIYGI